MSKVTNTKNDIISKLEAIKKINDNPNQGAGSVYDKYLKDLPSLNPTSGKKLGNYLNKTTSKKENSTDIFSDLIGITNSFLGTTQKVGSSDKLYQQQKLKQYTLDSAKIALESSKGIINNSVKSAFFSGDGICGTNTSITTDSVTIKPSEIDFLNILTVEPTTNVGQIIYEPSKDLNKQKVNSKLYSSFTGPGYNFTTNSNNTLFTSTWNSSNQEFQITGLTQGSGSFKADSFFNEYYSSIEHPDMSGVTKNAMLMTIHGDGSESLSYNKSTNDLNRLLKKLFAVCGTPNNPNLLKNQNATNLLNENDEDIDSYFNFDDVEGIDIDEEDARLRKVLKFRDCDNFEVPTNTSIIEDFVYLSNKKTLNDLVNTTLNKTAMDAYEQSNGSIPLTNFHLSSLSQFISNIPKAIIASILSPKTMLPIVMMYKLTKSGGVVHIKDLMRTLSKLFHTIIKEVFWKFIREFWKRIKADLVIFLLNIAQHILKNKFKRYITIVTALIAFLTKILQHRVNNCADLYGSILSSITTSLSSGGSTSVPNMLLILSSQSPGYSQDRAYLNAIERMNSSGVVTGPINGEPNDLVTTVKSTIYGHTEEMDTNGYVASTNSLPLIGTSEGVGAGVVTFLPGAMTLSGKIQ